MSSAASLVEDIALKSDIGGAAEGRVAGVDADAMGWRNDGEGEKALLVLAKITADQSLLIMSSKVDLLRVRASCIFADLRFTFTLRFVPG